MLDVERPVEWGVNLVNVAVLVAVAVVVVVIVRVSVVEAILPGDAPVQASCRPIDARARDCS